jgi:hypothetical protein
MKKEIQLLPERFISKTFFVFLLIVSLHFWNLRGIPQKFTLENMLVWAVCGFCFIMVIHKSELKFRYAILLFLFGLILNSFSAYLNLGQSLKLTLLSFSFYYFIFLYFTLHYFEFNRKFLEKIIIVFAVIYSIIFTIQYKIYPYVIFIFDPKTAQDSRQLEIIGHGFLMLAYFLVLNRYLLNRRLINILLALGFFIVLMKSDFRTLIAGAILVTAIMVIRIIRFSARDIFIIVFIGLLFIGLTQYHGISYIIEKMTTQTESNINEGKKYVRLIQMEFFFKRYPKNISYFIIGGGKPAGFESIYSFNPYAMDRDYSGNYNIVWVDIGLLGFYIVVGGIAVLGILWYTIRSIFIKLPKNSIYLSCYFLYLLIVSFTNEEIYRDGIFTVQAIGLYLIDLAANDKLNSEEKAAIKETNI